MTEISTSMSQVLKKKQTADDSSDIEEEEADDSTSMISGFQVTLHVNEDNICW